MFRIFNEIKLIDNEVQLYLSNYKNSNIDEKLLECLIVGEDHRFYYHGGVDVISIVRAIYMRLFYSKRQGASTIAMQLVRTITNDKRYNIFRKIKEIILAINLTNKLSKNDILKMYLINAYFGHHMNGLIQACRRLNLNYSNISLHDAYGIIARLKYPEPKQHSIVLHDKINRRIAYLYLRGKR